MLEANVSAFPSRKGGVEGINEASRKFYKEAMEKGLIGSELRGGKTFKLDFYPPLYVAADKIDDLVKIAAKYADEGGLEHENMMQMVASRDDLENNKTVLWHSPDPEYKAGYTEDKWITLEEWLENVGAVEQAA